jgi:hypothetical protein
MRLLHVARQMRTLLRCVDQPMRGALSRPVGLLGR